MGVGDGFSRHLDMAAMQDVSVRLPNTQILAFIALAYKYIGSAVKMAYNAK